MGSGSRIGSTEFPLNVTTPQPVRAGYFSLPAAVTNSVLFPVKRYV
jgi:hypothetical protein